MTNYRIYKVEKEKYIREIVAGTSKVDELFTILDCLMYENMNLIEILVIAHDCELNSDYPFCIFFKHECEEYESFKQEMMLPQKKKERK